MAGVIFLVCVPKEVYENSVNRAKREIIIAENDSVQFSECTIDVPDEGKGGNGSKEYLLPPSENNWSTLKLSKSKSADTIDTGEGSVASKKRCKSWNYLDLFNKSMGVEGTADNSTLDKPMEQLLRDVLKTLKIENAVWCDTNNDKYYQVTFPLESGLPCESALELLNECGIGQRKHSIVSVVPCSIYYNVLEETDKTEENDTGFQPDIKKQQTKDSVWNKFVTSVRARLTVAQVVESIKADAALTFDFLFLLVIATVLSAIALAENNNVYLVSSMLISPMMGPVMAGTFGTVIRDKRLQKTGVQNELIGLGIASVVGFCYGLIICSVCDKYGSGDWPTREMVSRGELRTLWVGCLIALLSGAAVALGILGGNIASLVGVAISASLMPPAVNAGLLWAMAAVYALSDESAMQSVVKTQMYFDNEVQELAALGAVSMCLTFVNIVCIYLAGIIVFRMKEVAPISSRDQSRRFWKYDIKIARDFNKTQQEDEDQMNNISTEVVNFSQAKYNISLMNTGTFSNPATSNLYHSIDLERERFVDVNRMQYTWSPSTFAPRPRSRGMKSLYYTVLDNEAKSVEKRNGVKGQEVDTKKCTTSHNILTRLFSQNSSVTPVSTHDDNSSKKFTVTPAFLDSAEK